MDSGTGEQKLREEFKRVETIIKQINFEKEHLCKGMNPEYAEMDAKTMAIYFPSYLILQL